MATVTIRIGRKRLQENFTKIFLESFPFPSKRIKISRNYGILTACGEFHFIGLQILISSIISRYNIPILVLDVGMTPGQIEWLKRQRVAIRPFKLPKSHTYFQYPAAWFKSHYIGSSPFRNTIWLDADTMVRGDLQEIIDLSNPNAFFTSDHTSFQMSTLNSRSLYSYLPMGKYQDILPYFNSGVMVVNKKRDQNLINDWKYCVEQAWGSAEVAGNIACWDQGALKWALHKNDLLYLITPDKKFNYPAHIRHFSYPSTPESVKHWINSFSTEKCVILHWMGSPKPWKNWGEILDLDISHYIFS